MIATPTASQAAAADLVTVNGSAPVNLPPVPTAVTRFPVDPTTPGQVLTVDVLSIVAGSVESVSPAAVTGTYDEVDPAIVLTVATDKFVSVGRYDVAVRLTDASSSTQVVTLPLERATAELAVPASLTWTRTQQLCIGRVCLPELPGVGTPDDKPPLVVTAGAASRIVDLHAREPQGDAPRIAVTDPAGGLPLGPDGQLTLDYSTVGSQPGSVVRLTELVSGQVAGNVPVSFTVVTRRPTSLIGVVLLAGVGLAWLLRFALPLMSSRLALMRRRADLAVWLGELDSLYPDAGLRAATSAARRQLGRASDVTLTSTVASVTAEVASLEASLRALTVEHDALVHAARLRPGLESAEPALVEVRTRAAEALAELGRCDATAARAKLGAATDRLKDAAANPPQLATLDGVATEVAGRTAGAQGTLLTVVQRAQAAAAEPVPAGATAAALGEHLDRLATSSGSAVLQAAVRSVSDEADAVVVGLAQATPQVSAPELAQASTVLRTATDGEIVSALHDLTAAYDELSDRVQLAPAAKDRAQKGDVMGAFVPTHLGAVPAQAQPPVVGTDTGDVTGAAATPAPSLSPPGVPARAAVLAASIGLGFVQLLVAVVVVLVSGYALFLPDWIGTNAQVGQVAVWAFALDTSLAGLVVLVTRTAPQVPASPPVPADG